jgi:hypothetical protein
MIQTETGENTTLLTLEPGDFVQFRYRSEDAEIKNREVLNLSYDEDAGLLHGLDLEHFSDQNLVNVGRELSRLNNNREEFSERFTSSGEILIDSSDNEAEEWYETKYEAERFEDNPYRTFRKDGIRNLKYMTPSIVIG